MTPICPRCGHIIPPQSFEADLSHEEFIIRLNPPVRHTPSAMSGFLRLLHNPLLELVSNPFKSKKRKKKS